MLCAPTGAVTICFPRLYAAASLKLLSVHALERRKHTFSAALCRGLIEARIRARGAQSSNRFSAALCRGLIEAGRGVKNSGSITRFSAALCRGLIEATSWRGWSGRRSDGFPRLYAAASLKRALHRQSYLHFLRFSAALCRGLIEAPRLRDASRSRERFSAALCRGLIEANSGTKYTIQNKSFSAALCRGLIEALPDVATCNGGTFVFRGFMPRPH